MKVAPPVPEVAGSETPMSPLYSGFSRSSQVLGGFLTTSVLTMMDGTPTNVATQPPVLAFQPAGRYFAFGGRYGGRTARASATGPNAMPISEKTATGLFFSASDAHLRFPFGRDFHFPFPDSSRREQSLCGLRLQRFI